MTHLIGSGGISTGPNGQQTNQLNMNSGEAPKAAWGMYPFREAPTQNYYDNISPLCWGWGISNPSNEPIKIIRGDVRNSPSMVATSGKNYAQLPLVVIKTLNSMASALAVHDWYWKFFTMSISNVIDLQAVDMFLTYQNVEIVPYNMGVPAVSGNENLTTGAIAYNTFNITNQPMIYGYGSYSKIMSNLIVRPGENVIILMPDTMAWLTQYKPAFSYCRIEYLFAAPVLSLFTVGNNAS